jgi:hypothetical protein
MKVIWHLKFSISVKTVVLTGCYDVKFDRRFQLFRRIYCHHIKGSTSAYWQEYGVYLIISLDVLSARIYMIGKRESKE